MKLIRLVKLTTATAVFCAATLATGCSGNNQNGADRNRTGDATGAPRGDASGTGAGTGGTGIGATGTGTGNSAGTGTGVGTGTGTGTSGTGTGTGSATRP